MDKFFGALCLSGAATIWGGMYVVSKYVLDFVPPMTLVNIRMAIAAIVLGLIIRLSKVPPVPRRDWPGMALLGFVGFTVSLGCQFAGTKLTSASMGAIITSSSPGFIVLFAWLLYRERVSVMQVAGLALASAGVLVIIGRDGWETGQSLAGNLFLVAAAITWGLYTVLGKNASRAYPPLTVSFYAMVFGTVFTLPLTLWELRLSPVMLAGAKIWGGILYLGVISTALAFYLWNKGFSLMDAGAGAVFFFLQPISGALLGWLLLGEQLTWPACIGGALILAGVALSSVTLPKKTPTAAAQ